MKPSVFIGSSSEAKKVAEGVLQNLSEHATITMWDSAFKLGDVTIDRLRSKLSGADFGVFVFAADDETTKRDETRKSTRDNVILELGMMLGIVGRERAFIIKPDKPTVFVPSDLLGVVTAYYEADRIAANSKSATQNACIQIHEAMREFLLNKQQSELGTTRQKFQALDNLVKLALEAICRAMSVPVAPHVASLRAFVFRSQENELVCQHFWDPESSVEEVGRTRFEIDENSKSKIVVVRCFMDDAIRRGAANDTESGDVGPLPEGEFADVKPTLKYVLAAPIRNGDGKPWGVVDFDASNDIGKKLLATDTAKKVITRLAEHLRGVLLS